MARREFSLAGVAAALLLSAGSSEARGLPFLSVASGPGSFFPLAPCRVIDTRLSDGPLGGPALVAGADRVFPVAGACEIPSAAMALSVNVAVVGGTVAGNVRLHAGGTAVPLVSAVNYSAGQTRSNNAIVPLGASGELAAFVGAGSGTVHFILDVNGYFALAPATIAKTPGSSGDGQTGVQGTTLAAPLSATVTDGAGGPAGGVTVSWAMATGGGSVGGATSVTDASGIATQTATLGTAGGANTYTASVAGLAGSPVTFTATAAKVIAKSTASGDGQSGIPGTALAAPLSVTVTDGSSSPVGGITVGWAVATGGGSVGGPASVTDPSGIATQAATLGPASGANTYTASVAGLTGSPLTFSATGLADLGEPCSVPEQCVSGSCVDAVCCDTACGAVCSACDLGGSAGSCTLVPDGQDPDAECGGVSCVGYYHGWGGDTCYRKADVGAAQATCGGDGQCRTAAEECTASGVQGPATITCNPTCQDPNPSTCWGTTAGSCINVNPGNQTCGNGVCRVTVPQCVGGAPNTCVPNWGAATAEVCDDLDNDCDGTVDNGAFADAYETNNGCATYTTLPTVGSDQTLTQSALTLYPSGDTDYFRINAVESDSSCSCCDFWCLDEDFQLTVTLTVPAGAGSYSFCTDTVCGGGAYCQTVSAGTQAAWTWTLDGACPGNDSYSIYVRIGPSGGPGFECRPYTLSYSFVPGCFGVSAPPAQSRSPSVDVGSSSGPSSAAGPEAPPRGR